MKKSLTVVLAGLLFSGCDYPQHDVEIKYSQLNGSVGITERWSVDAQRQFEYTKHIRNEPPYSRKAKLEKVEYYNLDALVHLADFFSLAEEYSEERPLIGRTTYFIEVKESGKEKKIRIEGNAPHPKELDDLMNCLVRLKNEKFGRAE